MKKSTKKRMPIHTRSLGKAVGTGKAVGQKMLRHKGKDRTTMQSLDDGKRQVRKHGMSL